MYPAMLASLLFAAPTYAFGPLGDVTLYGDSNATQMVVLVADDAAVMPFLQTPALAVVHVRASQLLTQLAADSHFPCLYPASSFEDLSHFAEAKLGLPAYYKPALLGVGAGAPLVYAALSQTPPNTFTGAITLGLCAQIKLPRPLCKGRGLHAAHNKADAQTTLEPATGLEEPWLALQGNGDRLCTATMVAEWVSKTPQAQLTRVEAGEHENFAAPAWRGPLLAALEKLQPSGAPLPPPSAEVVRDLPLIEVPSPTAEGHLLAVMVSGDGGWASIDKELADYFSQHHVPTVGLSSLQYLWKPRSADEAGRDLTRILKYYLETWHKSQVLLVGFSLGADVLPFMTRRLPADLQARIRLVALLAPSQEASFEFHVSDWIGGAAAKDALPVGPEIDALPCDKVLCAYSARDSETPCPAARCARKLKLAGGHHLGGDYAVLGRQILEAVPLAAAPE